MIKQHHPDKSQLLTRFSKNRMTAEFSLENQNDDKVWEDDGLTIPNFRDVLLNSEHVTSD